jgi:hypothetical protein
MAKKPVQTKPSTLIAVKLAKPARARKGVTIQPPASDAKPLAVSSKSDQVLILLKRTGGATLDELMKATSWQSHSVRGFLSVAVRKRMGLTLVSERGEQGQRRYRITGETGA